MVDNEFIDSAEDALEAFLQQFSDYPAEKDGEYIIRRATAYIRRHDKEAQRAIVEVLKRWLGQDDKERAHIAIAVTRRLHILSALPDLEVTLARIRSRKSSLPSYYAEILENAINDLRTKERGDPI